MRIEKDSQDGITTIRLIGHFQSDHVGELKHQLVDIDVVRFLGICEAGGVEIVNCSPYIRDWMNQEKKV